MVSLDSLKSIDKIYEENEEQILNSGYRYATIDKRGEIKYFNEKEDIYTEYPSLNPNKTFFGTSPMLIDIGAANNTLEFQKENLNKDIKNFEKDLKNS